MAKYCLSFIAVLSLTACSSFSGLDAKGSFACKAPDGVLCESMSGIYSNAMQNNLPGQQVSRGKNQDKIKYEVSNQNPGAMTTPIYSGMPIRTVPRVLRVWFAPWEDHDGDLHDQSYVYLPIDSGQWLIEHNRQHIQDTYRPIRAAEDRLQKSSPGTSTLESPTSESPSALNPEEAVTIGTHQGKAAVGSDLLLPHAALPPN